MASPDVASAHVASPAAWRPQRFGRRGFRHVLDPLVEPLWNGSRVLAHVGGGVARLIDVDGAEDPDTELAAAVAVAMQAVDAIIDGYVTTDASSSGEGLLPDTDALTATELTRQMFLGGGARAERRERPHESPEDRAARRIGAGDVFVFVAVDLLRLDGESLLEVPLLERRRLLDAALVEDDLVRRGIHVRLPVDPWIPTWRALGFQALAFKAANSRYRPGEPNDDWATAPIPRR